MHLNNLALSLSVTGFGGFGGDGQRGQRGASTRPRRGNDLQTTLTLKFMEAVESTKKTITVRSKTHCKSCAGSGNASGSTPQVCTTCNGSGMVKLCAVCGVWCAVWGDICVVCGVWCVVCGVWCGVIYGVVCGVMECAVCCVMRILCDAACVCVCVRECICMSIAFMSSPVLKEKISLENYEQTQNNNNFPNSFYF